VTAARSNIEVSVSRATRSAMFRMSNSVRDVVVELDADYKVDEDAAMLGSILLHGTGRSLKGALLKDLLYDEVDRNTFAKHMEWTLDDVEQST
jgi:hypothetical protein